MIELTASHFDDLCRAEPVRAELAASEAKRRAGVLRYWIIMPTGMLLAAGIFAGLYRIGWGTAGGIVGSLLALATWVAAGWRLMEVGGDLKRPVLQALSEGAGLSYREQAVDPPGYREARETIFGGADRVGFGDLFEGVDAEGRGFAFYDGSIGFEGDDDDTITVFSGQVYAFPRRPPGRAQTAVAPDSRLFERGSFLVELPKIKFDADPAFEEKFEVYGSDPREARGLIGPEIRRILTEARGNGRSFLHVGPETVLVALAGPSRYEPGNMLRGIPVKDRVRSMFDDVRASLTMLRRLQAALDRAE